MGQAFAGRTRVSRFRAAVNRHKWLLLTVSLPALTLLWWLFRPEKLFIAQRVNEPSPFTSKDTNRIVYLGKIEGTGRRTQGRVTIYERPNGRRFLRVAAIVLATDNGLHLALTSTATRYLQPETILPSDLPLVDLGAVQSNAETQDFEIPQSIKPAGYNSVVIYGPIARRIIAIGPLEQF